MSNVDMNWRKVARIAQEMQTVMRNMRSTRDGLHHAIDQMKDYSEGDVYDSLVAKRNTVVQSIDGILVETNGLIEKLCADSDYVKKAMQELNQRNQP